MKRKFESLEPEIDHNLHEEQTSTNEENPPILNLPVELFAEMGLFLNEIDLLNMRASCQFFKPIFDDRLMHRVPKMQPKQFVLGMNRLFVLRTDGQVLACGSNSLGELGFGDTPVVKSLTLIPGLESVNKIYAGKESTLFHKQDGTVLACGKISFASVYYSTPTPLSEFTGVEGILNFSDDYVIFTRDTGTVWAWGNNDSGMLGFQKTDRHLPMTQLSNLTSVRQFIHHEFGNFILQRDGNVWFCDQLKIESDQRGQDEFLPYIQVPHLENITKIFPLDSYSIGFLSGNGRVEFRCKAFFHELASGKESPNIDELGFSALKGLKLNQVIDGDPLLILNGDKTVIGWGSNNSGQLGVSEDDCSAFNKPKIISDLTGVVKMYTAEGVSFFVKEDGTIWACGDNSVGQLGVGETEDDFSPLRQLQAISNVDQIISNGMVTLFIKDNSIWVSGDLKTIGLECVYFTPVKISSMNRVERYAAIFKPPTPAAPPELDSSDVESMLRSFLADPSDRDNHEDEVDLAAQSDSVENFSLKM